MNAPSTSSAAEPVEKVLRRLFWKLFFRGRVMQRGHGDTPKGRSWMMGMTMVLYAIIGVPVALAGKFSDVFACSALLHGLTLVMVLISMAANAGSLLFNKEESEILLHRPVTPGALLRAKVWVLVMVSCMLGGALNLAGLIGGSYAKGSSWLFFPAHLVSTMLLTVFAAASLVLVYNLCLRWFGRERLDNLMTIAQTFMSIVLVMGSQLLPRMMGTKGAGAFTADHVWVWFLPTSWFAAFDAAVASQSPQPWLWGVALLAVLATVLVCWLALGKLAGAYGEGLVALNEGGGALREKRHGRFLAWLVNATPLRLWLRHPVERHAFLLTGAYMFRDRETKLRLYPGLAPMVAYVLMFLVFGMGSRGSSRGFSDGGVAFAGGYLAFVPVIAMDMLRMSEHWRAAEVFRAAPLAHWSPLFDGGRKAIFVLLVVPSLVFITGIAFVILRDWKPLMLLLPNLVLLPVWFLVPAIIEAWVPLSRPFDQQKQTATGCLKMMLTIGVSMAVAGLGYWAWTAGWFGAFLLVEAIVVFGVTVALRVIVRRMAWPEE